MQTLPESVRKLWVRAALLRAVIATALVALLVFAITREADVTSLVWLAPVVLFIVMAATGVWWANARWRGVEL